jgi:hypothetical protein
VSTRPAPTSERGTSEAEAPNQARPIAQAGLALFADCLLVGVFTLVAAVPVVTGYAALVAACATVREHVVAGRSARAREYLARLLGAIRSGPVAVMVTPLAVAGLVAVDALAVASGVPGAGPLAVVLAGCAAAAAVVGLRAAAAWRPGERFGTVAWAAAIRAVRDPGGSALLLLAAVAAATIVVVVPITALLIGGPLALAAVAVDGGRSRV